MKAKKKLNHDDLDDKFKAYDVARTAAKEAATEQADLGAEIKEILEASETDYVDSPQYTCSYKQDKDTEKDAFDEEAFHASQPAAYTLYRKFVKKTVKPGSKKLIVTLKGE